jgi:4-carboxymuconolactone decarboxylase
MRQAALPPSELDAEQRVVYDHILDTRGAYSGLVAADGSLRGPLNNMLLSPPVGGVLEQVGMAVWQESTLTRKMREIVTLVVAAHVGGQFEQLIHEPMALKLGLTEAEIDTIRGGTIPPLADERDAAAAEVAHRLVVDGDIDDEAWARLSGILTNREIFELTTQVGYYSLLNLQSRVFRMPHE